ncbi:MAG: bis(5'-nucleosyl)-tetraphosphatase (symmetrical) YqeK [Treponema sp.]|nr:bis(5'-nucleosyl)-tetraphosphatase (symmetrical) YqeK [Treponema sp.]
MALNLNDEKVIQKVIDDIDSYLRTVVSPKRYAHSVRTAQTARKMCDLYGLDGEKGYLAGIAHDMCKEFSDEDLFKLVEFDGLPVSGLEKEKPSLLHGRAAAVLIEQKFGVDDKEIKEAIANHTFASPHLCDLGKILFAADKIEPGRPQSTDEYRANLFAKTLNELALSVLQENIEYLESRGKIVAAVSYTLRDELLQLTGGLKK